MQDSVRNTQNWEIVDGMVVPSSTQESLMPYGMTASKAKSVTYKAVKTAPDSVAKAREDSIIRAVNDSLAHIPNNFGIVLQPPYQAHLQQSDHAVSQSSDNGLSWIFAALGILFCVVCIKLKNAPGYMMTLMADAKEVRMRHNMFDNTVKETSFLIILLIGWICCVGILLWQLVELAGGAPFVARPSHLPHHTLHGSALCASVLTAYVIFMLLSYELAGHVFADHRITRLWVKGATAGMALQTFLFFPVALLALCYPEWNVTMLWIGAGILGIGKILFIYKGFMIFFQQIRSWLLFLCYLCSLEIVPLILAYLLAYQICVKWL